jgi:eukaryotic-like serine/threonine-protein kinase
MEAHVKETPRAPIELQPTLPKAFSDLVMMSVAKDPAQRFQTADAFRNALSQLRASLPQPAAHAATVTMLGELPTGPIAPASTAPTQPLLEKAATPSAVMTAPVPAKGGRGLLLGVAGALVLLALAGAWIYKSRQHGELAAVSVSSAPSGTAPQGAFTPAASAPAPDTTTPAPQPALSQPASTAAANASAAPAQGTAPRNLANKRGGQTIPNASSALTPGGSAPDSQVEDQAAAALAQKKLLDDMEKESDQLDSRAAAVESSLDTLEQQMHSQGLGLRGDIVSARGNMRNDLAKAKQAMDSADTDRARRYLDMAHHEVEKLEAFLGRR